MAVEFNTATFDAFVKFARTQDAAGKEYDIPADYDSEEDIPAESEAQILKLVVDHTQKVHPDVIEKAEQNADKPIVFTEL